MSEMAVPRAATPVRVALILAAVAAMLAAVAYLGQRLLQADGAALRPASVPAPLGPPGEPIASEADVFRTRPGELALDPAGERRGTSHPRTLATFHRLRAYPGAPPRIPHGLSADEHRDTGCNTCHERGGYVPRFAAYAPVTPHPELAACQQCHTADARVVGTPRPDGSPNALCMQCHAPGQAAPALAATEWRAAAWPRAGQRALAGSPPWIPHDFQLRGNCVACHAGPGAVAELRTTHPERANCRQCHVPAASEVQPFVRAAAAATAAAAAGPGGAR